MSRRKNFKTISANYSMSPQDVGIYVVTASIDVDLPVFDGVTATDDDGINLKAGRELFFYAREGFDLNIVDGLSIFEINGLTSYTIPAQTGFAAYWYLGRWFLDFFDVTASGGSGITDLTGDVTATGPGSVPATIANDAVTFAKMQNIATDRLIGRDAAGAGDPAEIALNSTLEFDGSNNIRRAALTGDVTAPAGSNATTITNNAVTVAKMQQVAAYKFLANDTNATANLAEHDFQDEAESAITATITFTGTAAPSGASTLSQWFVRIGNTVFYKFFLTYATAGTAITQVKIGFPPEFPTVFVQTGLSAGSQYLYMCDYARMLTTPSGTMTSNANAALKRNAGNTANEFVFVIASNNPRTIHMGGSYRCT